jgi:hypothetical protein
LENSWAGPLRVGDMRLDATGKWEGDKRQKIPPPLVYIPKEGITYQEGERGNTQIFKSAHLKYSLGSDSIYFFLVITI